MIGLAHRGFELNDYGHHIVHTLRDAGYWTGLVGEQHLSRDPGMLGYDHVVDIDNHHVDEVAPAALRLIAERPSEPFFLSIGFFETHREYFEPTSVRDSLYSLPPANLPDTAETRRDMASYKASARSLDHGVGAVLNALDEHELADDTIVILTTDHGLAFPGAKATLTDRGLGVMLIVRGPGGFHGGKVSEALVSQIDLFPTLCEPAGIPAPDWLQGRSLLPLVRGEATRSTTPSSPSSPSTPPTSPSAPSAPRHKYIRRFGERRTPVLPNVDDGPTKDLLVAHGWAERELPREELHDLLFDPAEAANVAEDPAYADVRAELAGGSTLDARDRRPAARRRRRAAAGHRDHRPRRRLAGRPPRSRIGSCRPQPCGLLAVVNADVPSRTPWIARPRGRPDPPRSRRPGQERPLPGRLPARKSVPRVERQGPLLDDGDTLDADVPGTALGGLLRVRVIGAQAMEQTSYRAAQRAGDCHALDATNRLEQLVESRRDRSA